MRTAEMRRWIRSVGAILRKDIHSELRTRYAISALVMFVVTTIAVLLFALGQEDAPAEVLAGTLWIVIFFGAMSGLSRTFVMEEERGTSMTLQLLAPPPGGLFRQAPLQRRPGCCAQPFYRSSLSLLYQRVRHPERRPLRLHHSAGKSRIRLGGNRHRGDHRPREHARNTLPRSCVPASSAAPRRGNRCDEERSRGGSALRGGGCISVSDFLYCRRGNAILAAL